MHPVVKVSTRMQFSTPHDACSAAHRDPWENSIPMQVCPPQDACSAAHRDLSEGDALDEILDEMQLLASQLPSYVNQNKTVLSRRGLRQGNS